MALWSRKREDPTILPRPEFILKEMTDRLQVSLVPKMDENRKITGEIVAAKKSKALKSKYSTDEFYSDSKRTLH